MPLFKAIEFPGKEFNTQIEMLKHIANNQDKIISIKKATIKNSEGCLSHLAVKGDDVVKGLEGLKDENVYPIINTTNIMDSHNDVHLPKIWNKSLKEQQGKVFYVTDHDLKVNSVIAFPKDVTMSAETLNWNLLGKSFEGETQALMFSIPKDSIQHEGAQKIISEKIDIQHSVRMQYVKMFLAVDSEDKELKAEKKAFDKYIDAIVNSEQAKEIGYFWGVSEAKISQEGSMVLFGSNDATPMMFSEKNESEKSTQEEESLKNTLEMEEKRKFLVGLHN